MFNNQIIPKTIKAGPLSECHRIPVEDISVKSRKVKFNPNSEYGRAVEVVQLNDEFVIQQLHKDAKRVLPKGTPYELRAEVVDENHFRVGWLYLPVFMGKKRGLYGTRVEGGPVEHWEMVEYDLPYLPPSEITIDSWGKYRPELGVWVRGMFYA